eukprot:XP_011674564.1 PREDICTED: vacuolar protein sorting-associated protein 27 [Strongylocentrotus purpuratus]
MAMKQEIDCWTSLSSADGEGEGTLQSSHERDEGNICIKREGEVEKETCLSVPGSDGLRDEGQLVLTQDGMVFTLKQEVGTDMFEILSSTEGLESSTEQGYKTATITEERLDSRHQGVVETIVGSRINYDEEPCVGMVVHMGSKRSQHQACIPPTKKQRVQVQQPEEETTLYQQQEEKTPELPSKDDCELRFRGIPELWQPTSRPTEELQRHRRAPYHARQPTTRPAKELERPQPAPYHAWLKTRPAKELEKPQPAPYHQWLRQPTTRPTKELKRPQPAPYHTEPRQPTTRPAEELQRHQPTPDHAHQPTNKPAEELQGHQPTPDHAHQPTTRPAKELQSPQPAPQFTDLGQAAPSQSQHPIDHQPELHQPSSSTHISEAQPPEGHLESLILQLSSKLTELQEQQGTLVREVQQLREEVRTLSGVKEKCPPVYTPVFGTNSKIFIGSAESRLEMDKADYMKCWEAASTPKDLVLSLLSVHFTYAELAASNFNGGEVVSGGKTITKTALRRDSRFIAIVSQAEAQFSGAQSPALQKQIRDAVNNKCRKSKFALSNNLLDPNAPRR